MNKILSFGAGVNSTAILVLHATGKYHIDAVVFADTWGEHPETYAFIENTVKPLCSQLKLPFHTVSAGNLYAEYWEKKIIPFRRFRSCTDKFKIRPLKQFAKTVYGDDAIFVLGIDYGERHRVNRFRTEAFEYPLIDLQLDRNDCLTLISDFGIPAPRKSGCFYCPFTRRGEWLTLLKNHRDLFLKAEALEQHAQGYPKYTLSYKRLEDIRNAIENQQSLCLWVDREDEPCVFCHD